MIARRVGGTTVGLVLLFLAASLGAQSIEVEEVARPSGSAPTFALHVGSTLGDSGRVFPAVSVTIPIVRAVEAYPQLQSVGRFERILAAVRLMPLRGMVRPYVGGGGFWSYRSVGTESDRVGGVALAGIEVGNWASGFLGNFGFFVEGVVLSNSAPQDQSVMAGFRLAVR